MKRKILKNIEWGILICTLLLVIIGLVALTSATKNSNYEELEKMVEDKVKGLLLHDEE